MLVEMCSTFILEQLYNNEKSRCFVDSWTKKNGPSVHQILFIMSSDFWMEMKFRYSQFSCAPLNSFGFFFISFSSILSITASSRWARPQYGAPLQRPSSRKSVLSIKWSAADEDKENDNPGAPTVLYSYIQVYGCSRFYFLFYTHHFGTWTSYLSRKSTAHQHAGRPAEIQASRGSTAYTNIRAQWETESR